MDYKNEITWNLKTVSINSLINNPKNPREIDKKQQKELQTSIKKFGLCQPIVTQPSGEIIGGHQRVKSAKKLGLKEIEVYIPNRDLTSKEFDELSIRLNKNIGDWDYDILANQWEQQELLEWGFDENDFDIDVEEILSEDEEIPEVEQEKEPNTKLGDLYELGNHRLLCGDSTNPDDVAKLLDGAEPILMVTDPPYGVNYDPEWRNNTAPEPDSCRFKKNKHNRSIVKVNNDKNGDWFEAYLLFPGDVCYIWHSFKMSINSLTESGFELISEIIWVKQHFAISRGDYHWQHEPCWYAAKKGKKHNWQGSRKESTVWEIDNLCPLGAKNQKHEKTNHSTQKPLECMRKPIRNNTAKGEGVYDPFVGSGTTLIACEELDRNCFAMEIDPIYCDIVIERWKNFISKKGLPTEVIKNGKKED